MVPFVSSSPNLCLAEQIQEFSPGCVSIGGFRGKEARYWYTTEQMALFSWSSLGHGFFSGRFSRDNLTTFTDSADIDCIRTYGHNDNFERLNRISILAEEKKVKIPQLALAYLFHQPMNLFAIVGCYNAIEFKENLDAFSIKLSDQEVSWLELYANSRQ